MLRGRQRYRSHGGIPYGSTNAFGNSLLFNFQYKENQSVEMWVGTGPSGVRASQDEEDNQPSIENGGMVFESGSDDHMDLSATMTVSSQEGFVVWTVIQLNSHSNNQVLLGLSGSTAHWLEFKAGADIIRCFVGSGSATEISPGNGAQNHFEGGGGNKILMTLEREAGGTGNFNLWKNGVLLAQDSQAANTGAATFDAIGQRGSGRFLNSTVYDLVMVDSGKATREDIDRVNAHLCSKHAIPPAELANP